ncbi:MAG: 50S ribosomal protein L1 [Chlamydiae bacterium]|nr:50S ribosomal protein L1 [Chlamydiota bacterium]
MTKLSKRLKEIEEIRGVEELFSLQEAIEVLKKCPPVKFDQSVEVSLKSGIDVKKSDQQVRGTVALPHGIGKELRVLVFARGDKVKEAEAAGADFVGNTDLFEKIKGGWTDFDAVVATPDMMRDVGKLGRVLGPRGLMPTPKTGTVTTDVTKAVTEVKAGKIEFKNDKSGMINNLVGKLSFDKEKLVENIEAFISAVSKAKPSSAKGHFLQSLAISSTMGPGLKVDLSKFSDI